MLCFLAYAILQSLALLKDRLIDVIASRLSSVEKEREEAASPISPLSGFCKSWGMGEGLPFFDSEARMV